MMRVSILAITSAFALVGATSAFADQVTGTIARVNTRTDSIILDSGKAFTLPEGIEAKS